MAATPRDSILTQTSGTSAAAAKPTVAAGDILIAAVFGYGTDVGMTAPAGWTQLTGGTVTTPFTTGRAKLFRKTAPIDGSEGSTFTFQHDEADSIGVIIVSVQGADTSSPIDGVVPSPATSITTLGNSLEAPAVSPSGEDSLMLSFWACYPNAANTPPTWTLTGVTKLEDGGTWDHYAAGYDELQGSGSSGGRLGQSSNSGSDKAFIAMSVAIKSASGGVDPVNVDLGAAEGEGTGSGAAAATVETKLGPAAGHGSGTGAATLTPRAALAAAGQGAGTGAADLHVPEPPSHVNLGTATGEGAGEGTANATVITPADAAGQGVGEGDGNLAVTVEAEAAGVGAGTGAAAATVETKLGPAAGEGTGSGRAGSTPAVRVDIHIEVDDPILRPAFEVDDPILRWAVDEPTLRPILEPDDPVLRWAVGEPSLLPDRS